MRLVGAFGFDARDRLADAVPRLASLERSMFTDYASAKEPGTKWRIRHDASTPPEGYELRTGNSGIDIAAGSVLGVLRAFQTVRSLALAHGRDIPCVRVEDAPRFAWRGCMLDSSRTFFPVDWIFKFLDALALVKINRFHWHLTDDQGWRLELPSLPGFAEAASRRMDTRLVPPEPESGFYSKEDVAGILAFAADRGIEVVPEIEMPGHVRALLSVRPDLACTPGPFETGTSFGIYEDILCTGNPEVLRFADTVMGDVAAMFPFAIIHSGGDEVSPVRWNHCPKCSGLRALEGLSGARAQQGRFTRDLADIVRGKGRRLAVWDEALSGDPPEDTVIFSWRGSSYGREAARGGHDVVMCPETHACYLDHKHLDTRSEPGRLGVCTVRDSYSFDPMEGLEDADAAVRSRVLGLQGNLWTEELRYGRWVEYQAFPRISALAETGWTAAARHDWASFERRLPIHSDSLRSLGMNVYGGAPY